MTVAGLTVFPPLPFWVSKSYRTPDRGGLTVRSRLEDGHKNNITFRNVLHLLRDPAVLDDECNHEPYLIQNQLWTPRNRVPRIALH